MLMEPAIEVSLDGISYEHQPSRHGCDQSLAAETSSGSNERIAKWFFAIVRKLVSRIQVGWKGGKTVGKRVY